MEEAEVLLKKLERSHTAFYSENIFWRHFKAGFSATTPVDVLEIACGPGLFLRDLFEYININHAVGTDFSKKMLDSAKQTLASHITSGKIEIAKLDFNSEAWSLKEKKVDLIFIGLSFRNINQPGNFLQNVTDYLKPDGKFTIFYFCRQPYAQFKKQWIQYTKRDTLDEDFRKKLVDKYSNFCQFGPGDIIHLCSEFGLKEICSSELPTVPLTYLSFFQKV